MSYFTRDDHSKNDNLWLTTVSHSQKANYISFKTVIVSKVADKIVGHCYQKTTHSFGLPGIEEESESIIKYT